MHRGKLIVIEGTDGSGKQTQTAKLYDRLTSEGYKVTKISFPRYGNPMALPVERQLAGDLGKGSDINPYGASLLYAIDQWDSYQQEWSAQYLNGEIILADRYATSNMLHQGSKLDGAARDDYINWLKDLMYKKFNIPKPDIVLYLNVDQTVAEKILKTRKGKEGIQHDVYERDLEYQRKCKQAAISIAQKDHWHIIQCTENNQMLSIETIHDKIMQQIGGVIKPCENTVPAAVVQNSA